MANLLILERAGARVMDPQNASMISLNSAVKERMTKTRGIYLLDPDFNNNNVCFTSVLTT